MISQSVSSHKNCSKTWLEIEILKKSLNLYLCLKNFTVLRCWLLQWVDKIVQGWTPRLFQSHPSSCTSGYFCQAGYIFFQANPNYQGGLTHCSFTISFVFKHTMVWHDSSYHQVIFGPCPFYYLVSLREPQMKLIEKERKRKSRKKRKTFSFAFLVMWHLALLHCIFLSSWCFVLVESWFWY